MGFITGDLTKGNRKATPEDIRRLTGFINGVPKGLAPCGACGELRGECLDNIQALGGTSVTTVHCSCQNDNLCACCEKPLSDQGRLNGNSYNSKDKGIWHLPGFTAFDHTCS